MTNSNLASDQATPLPSDRETRPTQRVGTGWRIVIFVIVIVALTTGLLWLWLAGQDSRQILLSVAVIVGVVGVYPLTYVAYLGFSTKAQRKRLEDDFRLLGLESEEKLAETVEKLYQTVYSPVQFIAYIGLIVIVSLLVLGGYFWRDTLKFISSDTMTLVFYAYAGAYLFSIQELVRRYNTFDLQPQVYSSILVRMSMAVILVFVGASVINLSGAQVAGTQQAGAEQGASVDPQAWAAILAFVIGIFPSRGVRWFVQQTSRVLVPGSSSAVELPLSTLLGLGTWHEARLSQMGLDDAQNLATVDIRKLLLTTQFDTQEIVNWIDQAILYTKVGVKIDRFRDAKITTFYQYRLVLLGLSLTTLTQLTTEQRAERQQARERLALVLGMQDADELDRMGDYSGYPNYSHIAEYYARTTIVARQRANVGMEVVAGAIRETNFERAVEDGERLRTLHQDDPRLLNNLGYAYYRLGKLDQALACYNEAIRLAPSMAEAYYNRSLVYTDKGQFETAISDGTKALNIDRTNAKALNNRGLAYMKMGYLDRAVEDLNEALRLDDRLAEAYLNRGVAYNAQSKFKDAAADFEKAYLLDNRVPELWLAWGISLIGLTAFDDAIDKLSQAVLYATDSAKAYTNRGYAYYQLGQDYYAQARIDLETAIARDSRLPDAYNNLGLLEGRLNNYAAAIQHYRSALEVDHSQFITRYNLAMAYLQVDNQAEAHKEFSVVLRDAPKDSFEYEQAQVWLARLATQSSAGQSTEQSATGEG
jgi:tetratricopeptide (TPR) repeat protein